jgi:uncharacterized protein YebE (UPF0316 family)
VMILIACYVICIIVQFILLGLSVVDFILDLKKQRYLSLGLDVISIILITIGLGLNTLAVLSIISTGG